MKPIDKNGFLIRNNIVIQYVGDDKDVVIPDGVTEIFAKAFSGAKFRSIVFPESLHTIGKLAFSGCKELASVSIPPTVKLIRMGAFDFCTALESVTLPDHLTYIPSMIFYCCKNLKSIHFPSAVTKIEGGAFHGCCALKELNLPDEITSIGPNAFSMCTGLKRIRLPSALCELGACAFETCVELTGITIPKGVTNIPFNAFACCRRLTSVKIEGDVTNIGDEAFGDCTALSDIVLPPSVEIVDKAFINTAFYNNESNYKNGMLFIGDILYSVSDDFSGELHIPRGTRSIAACAVCRNEKITAVYIPSSVTHIACAAFFDLADGCKFYIENDVPDGWKKGWNLDRYAVEKI